MIRPNAVKGEIVPYDFRKPSRISAERHRILAASHEQLAQAIQRWIATRLRSSFEVRLESIAQESYGSFVASLADPTATFLYKVQERPGTAIAINLDPRVAFSLIEKLLGASKVSSIPDRPLTQLESVLLRVVTDRIALEIAEIWNEHVRLDLQFSRFESARELIDLTSREEDILLTTLRAEMPDAKGIIQFALPFSVFENFFDPPQMARAPATRRLPTEVITERHAIEACVRRAKVSVSARLPEFRTNLERLVALRPGDVLTVSAPHEEPVEVTVAEKPKFRARLGKVGEHLAVQITCRTDVE